MISSSLQVASKRAMAGRRHGISFLTKSTQKYSALNYVNPLPSIAPSFTKNFSSGPQSVRELLRDNKNLKRELEILKKSGGKGMNNTDNASEIEELNGEIYDLKAKLQLYESSSNSSGTSSKDETEKLKKEIETLKEEIKKKPKTLMAMFQNYGAPFVIYWASMYGVCFGSIYVALSNGVIGGNDAIDILRSLGVENYYDLQKLDPKYGNAAVALVLNEFLEAIRLPFCIATTPAIVGMLRKKKDQ